MKILALEPYYGGSHQMFLDGWISHSRHECTLLSLPASHWKWRMRHAAVTFARQVETRLSKGETWDVLFCSDMLNLAEFKGLAAASVSRLPTVVYFHENQLTYPDRYRNERDHHFAITNFTSCLAADAVWFNSKFHRTQFLNALPEFLRRMPDNQPLKEAVSIESKTSVHYPGINNIPDEPKQNTGPLRILWAARWEHDKGPELFFEAMRQLKEQKVSFSLNIIGEQFRETPEVFHRARDEFSQEIIRWGWRESREDYIRTLHDSDVIVSTAGHEFFGISVVEAIAAGVIPLLPNRLAYPEILEPETYPERRVHFYDGSIEQLVSRLHDLSRTRRHSNLRPLAERFFWTNVVGDMDEAMDKIARKR